MDFDNRKVYGDTSITDGLVALDTAPFGHYQVSGEYKNAQKKDIWKESEEEQMLYLTFWC